VLLLPFAQARTQTRDSNGTPSNGNAIEPMNLTVSDPPSQSEVQAVVDKLNELIAALKRQ